MHLTDASGRISNRNSSSFETLYENLPADTWLRFTFTVNPVNTSDDRYSLRVQRLSAGSYLDELYSDLAFQNDINTIDEIKFHYNIASTAIGGEYHIDNVLVTLDPNELQLQTDIDADGIDDVWEFDNFGNLSTADSESDSDGDHLSDLEEYHAGADPNDSQSRFFSPTLTNAEYKILSFGSSLSREYEIWWSEELTTWNLASTMVGTGNEMSMVVDTVTEGDSELSESNPSKLFLRVSARNPADLGANN